MKVICDECKAWAYGSQSELIEKGWCRAVFFKKKTITLCEKHAELMPEKIIEYKLKNR